MIAMPESLVPYSLGDFAYLGNVPTWRDQVADIAEVDRQMWQKFGRQYMPGMLRQGSGLQLMLDVMTPEGTRTIRIEGKN